MKLVIFAILLSFSTPVASLADKLCDDLKCVDKKFIKRNFKQFGEIFRRTVNEAKGCKDKEKVKKLLEFTMVARGSIDIEEAISHFIEYEFMDNPPCILTLMKEISPTARKEVAHYLGASTYIHGKKIRAVLEKYKKQFPEEYYLMSPSKRLKKAEEDK